MDLIINGLNNTIGGLSLKSVLTNMSFSSRAAAIRQRSPKSQVIFAFVFSRIGDFVVFLGLIFFKLRRVCIF